MVNLDRSISGEANEPPPRPSSETSVVVNQCAKYGDIRGYERLKDYYTKEKMQYFLVTFNHERDVDAAVKALRHKKKYGS